MRVKEPGDSLGQVRAHPFIRPPHASFAGELVGWLRSGRKWWLLPVVIVVIVLGSFILMSSTLAAPFVYTFF